MGSCATRTPEVAIAYAFDSLIDSHPNGPSNTTLQYLKPAYTEQVRGAFEAPFRANIDTAIINIGHDSLTGIVSDQRPGLVGQRAYDGDLRFIEMTSAIGLLRAVCVPNMMLRKSSMPCGGCSERARDSAATGNAESSKSRSMPSRVLRAIGFRGRGLEVRVCARRDRERCGRELRSERGSPDGR